MASLCWPAGIGKEMREGTLFVCRVHCTENADNFKGATYSFAEIGDKFTKAIDYLAENARGVMI